MDLGPSADPRSTLSMVIPKNNIHCCSNFIITWYEMGVLVNGVKLYFQADKLFKRIIKFKHKTRFKIKKVNNIHLENIQSIAIL